MKPTSVNITALSMVGTQSAYLEVGHDPEKSWDSPRIVVKSQCQCSQHLSHVLSWVIHTSVSAQPHPQCIMPSSFHSLLACFWFKLSDSTIYPGPRFMRAHLSAKLVVSLFLLLSHHSVPSKVLLVTQTFAPVSIRSTDLEHISFIIHYQPFIHSA